MTVSNTGQLPPEVLNAVGADYGGGSGSGSDQNNVTTGRAARYQAVGHLTLDLASLDPSVLGEEEEGVGGGKRAGAVAVTQEDEGCGEEEEGKAGTVSPQLTASPSASGKGLEGVGDATVAAAAAEGGVGGAKQARLALQLWWPLLAGLAGGAGDPRLDCRAAALSTLQDVLKVGYFHGRAKKSCCLSPYRELFLLA